MITIHLDSPIPLVEQIRRAIRQEISLGKLSPGSALPTVRRLARDLDINFNTVARAYRELENEGLLSTIQGRGTIVVSSMESPKSSQAEVEYQIENLLTDAKLMGLRRKKIQHLIDCKLDEFGII